MNVLSPALWYPRTPLFVCRGVNFPLIRGVTRPFMINIHQGEARRTSYSPSRWASVMVLAYSPNHLWRRWCSFQRGTTGPVLPKLTRARPELCYQRPRVSDEHDRLTSVPGSSFRRTRPHRHLIPQPSYLHTHAYLSLVCLGEPKSGTTLASVWAHGALVKTCDFLDEWFGSKSCHVNGHQGKGGPPGKFQ